MVQNVDMTPNVSRLLGTSLEILVANTQFSLALATSWSQFWTLSYIQNFNLGVYLAYQTRVYLNFLSMKSLRSKLHPPHPRYGMLVYPRCPNIFARLLVNLLGRSKKFSSSHTTQGNIQAMVAKLINTLELH